MSPISHKGPTLGGPDGSIYAAANGNGSTPVGTTPGLASIEGIAGTGTIDIAPAGTDVKNDGGPGHLHPAADVVTAATEPGTSAADLGTANAAACFKSISHLRTMPGTHLHTKPSATGATGSKGRVSAPNEPACAGGADCITANAAQPCEAPR